ncbi:response regulator transcription factor [candidate division KSB1 bacterium]|nr:response regulator transcription factor [candidate division KSB1 bacterium]
MKILIVDDNPRMRATLRKILERYLKNIEAIQECSDEAEAVGFYKDFKPDWVLMDIQLEKGNGLTATKMILELDPAAKILIVSQYDESAYREAAKNIGARGYVLKDNLLDIPGFIAE